MMLSQHFSLEELVASETAARQGIDNTPSTGTLTNLIRLAETLERARRALDNHAMLITSGYRSETLNRVIGGSQSSMHTLGLAADFICPSFGTPFEVCRQLVRTQVPMDQLIHEYGEWTHLGLASAGIPLRFQQLTLRDRATGYELG